MPKRMSNYKPPDGFVTVKTAAEILQISEMYVRILLSKGVLTRYKRQGYTLLLESELEQYNRIKES
jgi:excisionase family DNA binding protein